jgi:hypothetical protein
MLTNSLDVVKVDWQRKIQRGRWYEIFSILLSEDTGNGTKLTGNGTNLPLNWQIRIIIRY